MWTMWVGEGRGKWIAQRREAQEGRKPKVWLLGVSGERKRQKEAQGSVAPSKGMTVPFVAHPLDGRLRH